MAFERIIDAAQCPAGSAVFVRHGQRELAVIHLADPDRFEIIDNTCPHAGGNLAAGAVGARTITCPLHQWTFDLDTGYCVHTSRSFIRRYACKLEGGAVLADLSQPLPLPPPPSQY